MSPKMVLMILLFLVKVWVFFKEVCSRVLPIGMERKDAVSQLEISVRNRLRFMTFGEINSTDSNCLQGLL